eukprot:GHUV01044147.1.p1 GENE.GHUV01044147.1~~GHUV01044147.1.p1  ORF type:complete len:232 (-),score=59.25 GHUV01044147.1:369-1064(-)
MSTCLSCGGAQYGASCSSSPRKAEFSADMIFYCPAPQICEAFNANRYPFPEDPARQRQMHGEVTARLRELHTTIEAGERHREAVLQNIAFNLDQWATQVRREKAIYHTLNKLSMDTSRKVLVAEAWCPLAAKPRVHEALRQAAMASSTQLSTVLQPLMTKDPPPTYFKTDLFTNCFQVGCPTSGRVPAAVSSTGHCGGSRLLVSLQHGMPVEAVQLAEPANSCCGEGGSHN